MERLPKIAGAGPLADYAIGQRVMTVEGFPGVIDDIHEGPADLTTYFITLDNGQGGGEYAEAEIAPMNQTESARIDASVEHTAADDYPELGTILADRLPPEITQRTAALDPMLRVYREMHEEGDHGKQQVSGCPLCYPLSETQQQIADAYRPVMEIAADTKQYSAKTATLHATCEECGEEHPAGEGKEDRISGGTVHEVVCPNTHLVGYYRPESLHEKTAKTALWVDTPQSIALGEAASSLVSMSREAQEWVDDDPSQVASRLALYLPPVPPGEQRASTSPVTADQKAGYDEGFAHGQEGITRNPSEPEDEDFRVGYDVGWAEGVTVHREPANSWDIDDLGKDQTADIPPATVPTFNPAMMASLQVEAESPFKHYEIGRGESYDWCRFRRESHCWLPKNLNEEASKQAGYAVWVPEDRGNCFRVKWEDQQVCPTGEPGPNSGSGGFTDATIPWERGGQRGGVPSQTWASLGMPTFPEKIQTHAAMEFTATWADVRKKAKRIRSAGGVRIVAIHDNVTVGHVKGDHGVYETELVAHPGKKNAAAWHCGCKWSSYSWGRSGPWKKFEGRMCSHALALSYEALARGMNGKTLTLDEKQPDWMDGKHVFRPGDYSKDKQRYSSKTATLPTVGPLSDDYWGGGGCGALALAFVTLVPGLKIGVEWGTGHDEGLVSHAAAYDSAGRSFDFSGTGHIDIALGNFGGPVEKDVDPKRVAESMRLKWSPEDPWEEETIYEAAEVINRHWGQNLTASLHPVHEFDDDSPAPTTLLAHAMLSEGQRYQAVRAMLLAQGVDRPVDIIREARSTTFWARFRGLLEELVLDEDEGVRVKDPGGPTIPAREILYPGYHPTKGLNPNDNGGAVRHRGSRLPFTEGAKDTSVSPSEHGDARMQDAGVSVKKTKDGKYYVCTHRARSKYYDSVSAITQKDIDYIRSTGSVTKTADEDQCPRCSDTGLMSGGEYTCQGCGTTFADPNQFGQFADIPGLMANHLAAYLAKKEQEVEVSGVVLRAKDTGRILMLQRALCDDGSDENGGKWEFPGGHHEDGDKTSLHAAIREWEEEVGQEFPEGGIVLHSWTSDDGIYQGHLVEIPTETDLELHNARVVENPDNDGFEQAAWWDPADARKNPALRPECKSAPWSVLKTSPKEGSKMDIPDEFGSLFDGAASGITQTAAQQAQVLNEWGLEAPLATLHEEPEPALPFTDGADDEAAKVAQRLQAALSAPAAIPAAQEVYPTPFRAASVSVGGQDPNLGKCANCGGSFSDGDTIEVIGGVGLVHKTCPTKTAAQHIAGFPLCAKGCNITLDAASALVNTTAGLAHANCPAQATAAVIPGETQEQKGKRLLAYAEAIARGEQPEGPNPFAHVVAGDADNEMAGAAQQFLAKQAVKTYTTLERQSIIDEGEGSEGASNLDRLDISGTHYEALAATAGRSVPEDEDLWMLDGDPNGADI